MTLLEWMNDVTILMSLLYVCIIVVLLSGLV